MPAEQISAGIGPRKMRAITLPEVMVAVINACHNDDRFILLMILIAALKKKKFQFTGRAFQVKGSYLLRLKNFETQNYFAAEPNKRWK